MRIYGHIDGRMNVSINGKWKRKKRVQLHLKAEESSSSWLKGYSRLIDKSHRNQCNLGGRRIEGEGGGGERGLERENIKGFWVFRVLDFDGATSGIIRKVKGELGIGK